MDKLRSKLHDYKDKEDRSIAWIARQIGVNPSSLQKFARGERSGLSIDNTNKLKTFLGEELC